MSNRVKPALLSNETANRLGGAAPRFDRKKLKRKILHIGPGAFFRAHQADYIDRLNEIDPGWGIIALSMRSTSVADALTPQDGLYTLVRCDENTDMKVISSLLEVHPIASPAAKAAFLDPDLSLITLTVTEKGYCLTPDGALDMEHPGVMHDRTAPEAPQTAPETPQTAPGLLLECLKLRRENHLTAPIILSCDNLPGNGKTLRNAVLDLASHRDMALCDWIEEHVLFPTSMVDSITPATDDTVRAAVTEKLNITDNWPIQRERFTQWVIERVDSPNMPPLDQVGVVFTDDVHAFEQAKLRMLNGPHSALAYYGLLRGVSSVSQAMAVPNLRDFIDTLMSEEIAPSINPPSGLDLNTYRTDLLARFANPAIVHNLSQIAWDGSQKLPMRLLATIEDNLAAGRPIAKLSLAVASWWRFVIHNARLNRPITDPLMDTLFARASETEDRAEIDIPVLLSLNQVFADNMASNDQFKSALSQGYGTILAQENWADGGR